MVKLLKLAERTSSSLKKGYDWIKRELKLVEVEGQKFKRKHWENLFF
jgi:hypothetical protein